MNGNYIEKKINGIVLFLLILATVFFSRDDYCIKKGLLFIYLILSLPVIIRTILLSRREQIIFVISVGLFVLFCFLSFVGNASIPDAVKGGYPCLYFLILYPVFYYKLDLTKYFIISLKLLTIMALLFLLLDAVNLLSIYANPILKFLYKIKEVGVVVKSPIYYSYYKIYYKASALLVVLLAYSLYKKSVLWGLASFIIMFFTGSDMEVVASVFIIAFDLLIVLSGKKVNKIVLFTGASIGIMLPIAIYSIPKLDPLGVRKSILIDVAKLLIQRPLNLVFGMGYNTPIYITARNSYENSLEWSFVEILRVFGLIGLVVFIVLIFYPLLGLSKDCNMSWVILCALGYIIVASTNPLLNNTTGFLLLLFLYYHYFISREKDCDYE